MGANGVATIPAGVGAVSRIAPYKQGSPEVDPFLIHGKNIDRVIVNVYVTALTIA